MLQHFLTGTHLDLKVMLFCACIEAVTWQHWMLLWQDFWKYSEGEEDQETRLTLQHRTHYHGGILLQVIRDRGHWRMLTHLCNQPSQSHDSVVTWHVMTSHCYYGDSRHTIHTISGAIQSATSSLYTASCCTNYWAIKLICSQIIAERSVWMRSQLLLCGENNRLWATTISK